ncbi:hypothetical protein CDD82_7080 [Ophiocordyceps australis]|uniref:Fungal N-terminal domain-containing protein n=1 Tax=Ophiocordyceps australis TaxID=1399860 RepID=A0A2C5YUB3_9HYPO|nr:hypothetical protein CDD82_7080 [Ophiocordyceps australis]
MAAGNTTLELIDAVDAFARTLFIRAQRCAWPCLGAAAAPVGHLHLALRHLRVEAADADSLLTTQPTHARRTDALVRDCHQQLRQLQLLLDQHDRHALADAPQVTALVLRLEDQRAAIDALLDAVQLRCPPPQTRLQANEPSLEAIKDKLDHVATTVRS